MQAMQQRWRYRCYPTAAQEEILTKTFGCVRYIYNWGLVLRSKAFQSGSPLNYADTSAALTRLKSQPETVWLNDVSSVPLQHALRDLQTAYSNFFAKRCAYPRFKKKSSRQSAYYNRSAFTLTNKTRLKIAKMGFLKVRWHRLLPTSPSSVTIIREATGRYYVSFVIDIEVAPFPQTGQSIGIDFGISRLATLSTGTHISNPKHLQRRFKRLIFLHKNFTRKIKDSRRRDLAQRAYARCHQKIYDARKDTINKLTTRIVMDYDIICIEDLNLRGMVKNHSLARSLNDASIGMAVRMLEKKAETHGKEVIRVDRFFPSSKMCSECGHIVAVLPLKIREWKCQNCGAFHDRDFNAAKNILAVGQTVTVHGDDVRAILVSAEGANRQ